MIVLQLVLVAVSVLSATCQEAATSSVYNSFDDEHSLGLAMVGFDPFIDDSTINPDAGSRGQIFDYHTVGYDGVIQMSPFIIKSFRNQQCTLKFHPQSFTNYYQYRESEVFRYATAVKTDSADSLKIGNQVATNDENAKIRKFLEETNGEIVTISNICVTHVVELDDYEAPVFTRSFAKALIALHIAATNSTPAQSVDAFRRFARAYGTHYRKKTYLGAKMVFEKRFANKSSTAAAEHKRQQCVRGAAAQASALAGSGDIVSLEDAFETKSESCLADETSFDDKHYLVNIGLSSEKITSLGSFPSQDSGSCGTSSMGSVPIAFELREMSSLFSNLQFTFNRTIENEVHSEEFKSNETRTFFDGLVSQYCVLILEKNCSAFPSPGCGVDNECSATEDCVSDSSAPRGYRCQGAEATRPASQQQVVNSTQPPATQTSPRRLVNVALNKPVTGSPTHRWRGYVLSLDQMTDGDSTHEFNFVMATVGPTPYGVVDLGQVYTIWGIRIMPRRDGRNNNAFKGIAIRTGLNALPGPDFDAYQEIVTIPGPPPKPIDWIEHMMETPLRGRYVSVQKTPSQSGARYLEVTELEVLAVSP